MARPISRILTIGGALLLLAVILNFALLPDRQPFNRKPPLISEVAPATPSGTVVTNREHSSIDSLSVAQLAESLTPSQRQRASWENPFVPALWHATGWVFDKSAMRPPASSTTETGQEQSSAAATFRRPYTQFVLSLTVGSAADRPRVETRPEHESTDSTALNERLLFIELLPQKTDPRLVIALSNRNIDVRVESASASPASRILGSNDWGSDPGAATDPVEEISSTTGLTIALTPSRLLIRRAGRLLINIQRPVAITGTSCFVRLKPGRHLTHLSNLRFEGE